MYADICRPYSTFFPTMIKEIESSNFEKTLKRWTKTDQPENSDWAFFFFVFLHYIIGSKTNQISEMEENIQRDKIVSLEYWK